MANVIWKDVLGYEGLYQVSNLGDVLSLNYGKIKGRNKTIAKVGKPYGYQKVLLYKKGMDRKMLSVHRLVAQAFLGLDISNTKMMVCHKDDNPLNNTVDNLFLGSCKDNMQDCANKGRTSNQGKTGKLHYLSKKVSQYNLEGKMIKEWDCLRDIKRSLGFEIASISRVCLSKQKTSYGFIWSYNN